MLYPPTLPRIQEIRDVHAGHMSALKNQFPDNNLNDFQPKDLTIGCAVVIIKRFSCKRHVDKDKTYSVVSTPQHTPQTTTLRTTTHDPQPATHDLQPMTQNPQPMAHDPKPMTHIPCPATQVVGLGE